MLTYLEVTLYVAGIVLLLPMTVYSLVTGAQPPESSPFARYYRAEKHLSLAANLFLLAACANGLAKLAVHFGYIGAGVAGGLTFATGAAFGLTLIAFLGLCVSAILKARRNARGSA